MYRPTVTYVQYGILSTIYIKCTIQKCQIVMVQVYNTANVPINSTAMLHKYNMLISSIYHKIMYTIVYQKHGNLW